MRCVAFAAAVLLVPGCGIRDEPVPVTGRVTFQGQPVTEGVIQFLHMKTQKPTDAYLGPDGRYATTVPTGWHTILIVPPTVADTTYGLPSPKFKDAVNIPAKYRMAPTSGLRVEVTEAAEFDFDLKP